MVLVGTLLLVAGVASAQVVEQPQPRTFRVPFHTINGMILLDATVNDKPVVLLLETGANNSIVDSQADGMRTMELQQ